MGADPNPFRYCGEYFDVESGSYYLRARYYDPSIGRFTQEDTAKHGYNWYAYCNNNPIRFVDPTGFVPVCADEDIIKDPPPPPKPPTTDKKREHDEQKAHAIYEENMKEMEQSNTGKNEVVVVNEWLNLNSLPSQEAGGQTVDIPSDIDKTYWAMCENLNDINKYAKSATADINTVTVGGCGELVDKDGRYWVAVGPKVINPNFPNNKTIYAEDMKYGTLIDVIIEDETGRIYYIYAIVGDAKAHTYPNGIYQTGYAFPNGVDYHPNNVDYSIIEFIGKGSIKGLRAYRIVNIIVY